MPWAVCAGQSVSRHRVNSGQTEQMVVPALMTVVTAEGTVEQWHLAHSALAKRGHRLVLESPSEVEWTAEASDVFECLMVLRQQLEPKGVRLCCHGSRRDAWASGMQRDMGAGLNTYLLGAVVEGERPPSVPTLDFAPPELVVSRDDQMEWHREWLRSRGA